MRPCSWIAVVCTRSCSTCTGTHPFPPSWYIHRTSCPNVRAFLLNVRRTIDTNRLSTGCEHGDFFYSRNSTHLRVMVHTHLDHAGVLSRRARAAVLLNRTPSVSSLNFQCSPLCLRLEPRNLVRLSSKGKDGEGVGMTRRWAGGAGCSLGRCVCAAPQVSRIQPTHPGYGPTHFSFFCCVWKPPKVAYRVPGAPSADWVDIYNRLYRERIIFLGQEIDDELANQIIGVLLVRARFGLFCVVVTRISVCGSVPFSGIW